MTEPEEGYAKGGGIEPRDCVPLIRDPLERQRAVLAELEEAREEWKRQARHWSLMRAEAVIELKQGRTWAEVGELLGVSEATAWNVAHPRERNKT